MQHRVVSVRRLSQIVETLQQRKAAFRLAHYNQKPVHLKQMAFHQCLKRNRWVFGGNRTGKTECGAVEAVWFARGNHPFRPLNAPTVGWVVSPTLEVQRDVAQQKILNYLDPSWITQVVMRKGSQGNPAGGIIDYIMIQSVHGGQSRIGFKSADQGRGSFQGTALDWVWFDEEPPEDVYRECAMRVLDRAGELWGTMTPLRGLTWVYEEIEQNRHNDPEVWHLRMTWADNPFLRPAEVARLEAVMDETVRQTRRDGRFAAGSGLVYPEFDEALHVIPPFPVPESWHDRIAIDPGLVNPLSAHWYACDGEGTVYIIAEHYQAEWTVEQHAAHILAQCQALNWPRDAKGRVRALFDPAVAQRTLASERSTADLFLDHGIMAETRVSKDRWAGIQRVREYLRPRPAPDTTAWPNGKPRLLVFNTCTQLIREIRGYRYVPGGEVPVKKNDHAMDELRYYLMARPEPASEETAAKNAVLLDKERLMRKGRGAG